MCISGYTRLRDEGFPNLEVFFKVPISRAYLWKLPSGA